MLTVIQIDEQLAIKVLESQRRLQTQLRIIVSRLRCCQLITIVMFAPHTEDVTTSSRCAANRMK